MICDVLWGSLWSLPGVHHSLTPDFTDEHRCIVWKTCCSRRLSLSSFVTPLSQKLIFYFRLHRSQHLFVSSKCEDVVQPGIRWSSNYRAAHRVMRQECVLGEDQEKRSSRSSQRDLPIGSSHAQARTLKNKHNFYQMEVCTRLSEKKKKKKLGSSVLRSCHRSGCNLHTSLLHRLKNLRGWQGPWEPAVWHVT